MTVARTFSSCLASATDHAALANLSILLRQLPGATVLGVDRSSTLGLALRDTPESAGIDVSRSLAKCAVRSFASANHQLSILAHAVHHEPLSRVDVTLLKSMVATVSYHYKSCSELSLLGEWREKGSNHHLHPYLHRWWHDFNRPSFYKDGFGILHALASPERSGKV